MDTVFKCNVHEALVILEEKEDLGPRQIFSSPPEPAVHSDEDSGDVDAGALINILNGRQLSVPCEAILAKNSLRLRRQKTRKEHQTESSGNIPVRRASRGRGRERGKGSSSRDQAPPSSSSSSGKYSVSSHIDEPARKKIKISGRNWIKEDLSKEMTVFPEGDYSNYRGKSSVE